MSEPFIKVGVFLDYSLSFELKGKFRCAKKRIEEGHYNAWLSNSEIETDFTSGKSITLSPEPGSTFIIKNVTIGIGFHWEKEENQEFEGNLELIREGDKIRLVNQISLEKYLSSVISSEMSAMNDPVLLQTHAIASRSWLLAQLQNKRNKDVGQLIGEDERITWYDRDDHELFDVCADDHCQRYQGITKIISKNAIEAVNATRGQVLKYKSEICDARFSKCCGGITEDFSLVWQPLKKNYLQAVVDGENKTIKADKKYFTSFPDVFCNSNDRDVLRQIFVDFDQNTTDFFRWKITYTQAELRKIIRDKSGLDFGNIIRLQALKRGQSGRISLLEIHGTKKTIKVGKELEIRKWLSESHLYSSAFVVEHFASEKNKAPEKFVLHGAGWGHGVGLCQVGAAVMSRKGYSPEDILKHYFLESRIETIY